ncbi:MAG: immune inhibitor A [Paludibacteraceae bacterium]|nr:immune inhibitor A [Paludibacteraceae bacterium]
MILSLDKINSKSPYRLIKLTDLTFRFVTDGGLHYSVGFYQDTLFLKEGAYHFFIDNAEGEHGAHDPKIVDVVVAVLEEFFDQEPSVMLYICDPRDNRQAARNRLYTMWYQEYAKSHMLTMFCDAVRMNDIDYYAGILMRHDHPKHDEILQAFQAFLKYFPAHYKVREK